MFLVQTCICYNMITLGFMHFNVFCISLISLLCFIVFNIHTTFISLHIANNINISAINVFKCTTVGIDPHTLSSVYTCNFNTVTGSYFINEVFISTQMDCLGSFSLRYRFRCFLNFNVLLV